MHKKLRSLFILLALTVLVPTLALTFVGKTPSATASSSDNSSGYAWSKYGYMFLNCTTQGTCGANPYGVNVSPTGQLSGYGWSPNIGWVNFTGVTLSCPSAGANRTLSGNATVVYNTLTENLNFAGVEVQSNGQVDPAHRYAWGNGYLGWVDFANAVLPVFSGNNNCSSLQLVATPTTVAPGGTATLTWSDINNATYTQCRPVATSNKNTSGLASNFQSAGALAVPTSSYTGATVLGNVNDRTDFQVECKDPAGNWISSTTASVTITQKQPGGPQITLSASPAPVITGNQYTDLSWSWTGVQAGTNPPFTNYCEPVQTLNGVAMNANTSSTGVVTSSNFRTSTISTVPTKTPAILYTHAWVPGNATESDPFMVRCQDTAVPSIWYYSDAPVLYVAISNPPACSISLSGPTCINTQNTTTATLKWSATNSASVSSTGFSLGGAVTGQTTVTPSGPTTYTASCTSVPNATPTSNTSSLTITPQDGPCATTGKLQIKEH